MANESSPTPEELSRMAEEFDRQWEESRSHAQPGVIEIGGELLVLPPGLEKTNGITRKKNTKN